MHSEPKIPWLAVKLLATALVAWLVGAGYTLRLNPELAFYRQGDVVKRAWADALARDAGPKIIVCGGSSCATSIDAERLQREHHLSVLNLGLHAGMGERTLVRYAFSLAKPGDTLVLALEPDLLIAPPDWEMLGIQFSFATGNPAVRQDYGSPAWVAAFSNLRPGGYHAFTLLGKVALHQPLYRYSPSDFHPGGWQEVAIQRDFAPPQPRTLILSPGMRAELAWLRDECARRKIRIACTLPWTYCRPEDQPSLQQKQRALLAQMAGYLPILRDPTLGTHTDRTHFADTPLHLTAAGAARRTDEFAQQVSSWELWTREELATGP